MGYAAGGEVVEEDVSEQAVVCDWLFSWGEYLDECTYYRQYSFEVYNESFESNVCVHYVVSG